MRHQSCLGIWKNSTVQSHDGKIHSRSVMLGLTFKKSIENILLANVAFCSSVLFYDFMALKHRLWICVNVQLLFLSFIRTKERVLENESWKWTSFDNVLSSDLNSCAFLSLKRQEKLLSLLLPWHLSNEVKGSVELMFLFCYNIGKIKGVLSLCRTEVFQWVPGRMYAFRLGLECYASFFF